MLTRPFSMPINNFESFEYGHSHRFSFSTLALQVYQSMDSILEVALPCLPSATAAPLTPDAEPAGLGLPQNTGAAAVAWAKPSTLTRLVYSLSQT